jgi:septum formation protein
MIKISEILKMDKKLILASQSPRRKKLLEQLGFEFEIIPADINEEIDFYKYQPFQVAEKLAEEKAKYIATQINEPAYVIGADTIVVLDDVILNKPIDEQSAFDMLRLLSDNTHIVYTGISIVESITNRFVSKFQKTEVTFRKLEDKEILAYIASGSPMDKAGSYGIQDDFGAVFVSYITGCYYNIVGLPIEMLYSTLKEFINAR